MFVIRQHWNVDGVADPHRNGVGHGDGCLFPGGLRNLDHGYGAFGLCQAIADAIVEGDRAGFERFRERHTQEAMVKDFDPQTASDRHIHRAGHKQHAPGRVKVGGEHVHECRLLAPDERRVLHRYRRAARVRSDHHLHPHLPGHGELAIGHRILDVVIAHHAAGEAKGAVIPGGGDQYIRLRWNTAQPKRR